MPGPALPAAGVGLADPLLPVLPLAPAPLCLFPNPVTSPEPAPVIWFINKIILSGGTERTLWIQLQPEGRQHCSYKGSPEKQQSLSLIFEVGTCCQPGARGSCCPPGMSHSHPQEKGPFGNEPQAGRIVLEPRRHFRAAGGTPWELDSLWQLRISLWELRPASPGGEGNYILNI